MIGFYVSLHRLAPGHELAADAPLLSSRRRALEAAHALDAANAYVCRAKRAERHEGTGAPRKVLEVLQVEEVRFHAAQVSLFARRCVACGEPFQPLRSGRPPKKCPGCRKKARAEFFADRARSARKGRFVPCVSCRCVAACAAGGCEVAGVLVGGAA